jgi:hypothetical protein
MILNKKSNLSFRSYYQGILLFAIIFLPDTLFAQYTSNSTYSLFGIGDIRAAAPIRTSAMGGASLALPSEYYINNLNPASLTKFDSTSFIFTAGISGYLSSFESRNVTNTASDFNFNHIALGFPVTKWWGAAAGVAPFSSVGYNVTTSLPIEGTIMNFETQFTGSGGVTQFYLLNTFRPLKQLSLGIDVSYLMGTITHTELDILKPFDYPNVSTTDSRYFRNFYYKFGLQFNQNIGDDRLSLGIICSPVQKLKSRHKVEILIPDVDTVTTEPGNQDNFIMPLLIGAGIAYNIHSTVELAFDYGLQNWSDVDVSFKRAKLTDSYHYNFGMEYFPHEKLSRNYFRVIRYRIGAYYEKTYIEMRGNEIFDRGVTVGAGFPIGRQRSTVDLALGLGRLGTLNDGLVQQTYGSIKIGFNFHDYWFIKRRFD